MSMMSVNSQKMSNESMKAGRLEDKTSQQSQSAEHVRLLLHAEGGYQVKIAYKGLWGYLISLTIFSVINVK